MVEFDRPDRRREPRGRVERRGAIVSSVLREEIACTVLDISRDGARLQVENVNVVPDAFTLMIEADGFEAECIVVWRAKADVGVIFEEASKHSL